MVDTKRGSGVGTLLVTAANLLIPAAILIFASGFFPYKPVLPGLAEYESLEYGPPPSAPFDKIIFMVVDALRSDFVYSEESGFDFTQGLIREGNAIPFTARARSPTVTMPRLKAITTGSIPSFVDLILNVNEGDTSSSLAAQDTWLAQLKSSGAGKLLLYGDDTWLKLFPDTFDRHDGTSSFFVADFTEVDNNVTRNIAGELENNDWGLMVLHYLGLDHIGHKSGPRSVNMVPKQAEMDDIVQTIYSAMQTKDHLKSTMLIMCGDHGMNDAGNHGASSPGETSPALVFMSPKLKDLSLRFEAPAIPKGEFEYYSLVEQSDLAPTISAFLGFPVSKNNLGAFIPEFLPFWQSPSDQIQILVRNARQILGIVTAAFGSSLFEAGNMDKACSPHSSDIQELACDWHKVNRKAHVLAQAGELDPIWVEDMSKWLRRAQDLMSSMASNYDMSRLMLGQGLAVTALVLSLGATWMRRSSGHRGAVFSLLPISICYGVMMFASSYVEEEHHFWYWASTMWFVYLAIRDLSRNGSNTSIAKHLVALLALRLTRSWNQTGQKFAGEPDIVKRFIVTQPNLLWALVLVQYALFWELLEATEGAHLLLRASLLSFLVSAAFTFKVAFTAEDAPELIVGLIRRFVDTFWDQSLVWRAQIVFMLLGLLVLYASWLRTSRDPRIVRNASVVLRHAFTMLALTQSRVTNIPLFLLSTIIFNWLRTLPLSVADITTTSLLLQFVSFFASGGSNAISSIDLSSAYNGVSGFNIAAVGLLTYVGNWAGPLYWTFATNALLLELQRRSNQRGVWAAHVGYMTVFTCVSIAFVMAACTALRTHLFIWTVFSPKYLYSIAWSLGQHLAVNVMFGSFLFWFGTPKA